jgi:nucleotide-binding universal stress UspA family protein
MIKKILIAYDGSSFSKRAFDLGLQMAALRNHEAIVVLSVVQLPEPAMIYETSALLEEANAHYEKDFVELRAAAKAAGVNIETRVAIGNVADQIIEHATKANADLIVMGHRGKSLIQRWLLGSVSKRVISYAPCSVLIVR